MKDKEAPSGGGISRRGFLKGASLGVATGALIGATADGATTAERGRSGRPDVLKAGARHDVSLLVNGKKLKAKVSTGDTLLEVLRSQLNLTGAKPVCDMGSCGACTVMVDGSTVNSCLTLAVDVNGATIETVEGLAKGSTLHPLQNAFIEEDAFQCGFCTSGMLMSCKSLLDRNPSPDRDAVKEAISGNLCRCGTYENIFRAMDQAGSPGMKVKGGK